MKIVLVLLAVAGMAFARYLDAETLPTLIEYPEQLDPLAKAVNQNTEYPNLELPEGIAASNPADSTANEDTNGNAISGTLKPSLFDEEVESLSGLEKEISELMREIVKNLSWLIPGELQKTPGVLSITEDK